MKKILIAYSPTIENDILKDRIRSLGKCYNIFNSQWIVSTNLTTKEVYERISAGEFESATIFISEITDYYGRMNTTLWDWFKAND